MTLEIKGKIMSSGIMSSGVRRDICYNELIHGRIMLRGFQICAFCQDRLSRKESLTLKPTEAHSRFHHPLRLRSLRCHGSRDKVFIQRNIFVNVMFRMIDSFKLFDN